MEQLKSIPDAWAGFATEVRRLPDGRWAAVVAMIYTWGLCVDMTVTSYAYRYCYAKEADAVAALRAWDGRGDPPGPWIKLKGLGVDRLGPGATKDEDQGRG